MIKNWRIGQSILKPETGNRFYISAPRKKYVRIADQMFCLTELKKIWKKNNSKKIIFLLFEAFLDLLEE